MKALYFIYLLVLFWTINIKASFSQTLAKLCFAKHGDFLAHPHDCAKFIRCSHNRAYEFQCADNLLWHHEIKSCDYPHYVKCTKKENQLLVNKKATRPAAISKFKREIKNNSYRQDNIDKLATTMKRSQTLTTVFNKLTALPTSTNLPSMLTKKLFKLTQDQTTILPCIKITDLINNHTETLKATGNLVNTTTNNSKFLTNQMKDVHLTKNLVNLTAETFINLTREKLAPTSSIELPTDVTILTEADASAIELINPQQEFKETTNLSVNLTKHLVNATAEIFFNLTTEILESISPLQLTNDHETLTEAETSSLELTTPQVELKETTNLSVNLTKNLVNVTADNFINITMDKLLATSFPELPTDQATLTESETSSLDLPTPQVELKETTNLSVNLTKNLVNPTAAATLVNCTTNKFELSTNGAFSIETQILAETENFVKLTTANYVKTTNQMESLSALELSTEKSYSDIETLHFLNETIDNLVNLTTETLSNLQKQADITDQEITTTTIDLTTINTELTTEKSISLPTTTSNSTTDTLQPTNTNTSELPTIDNEFLGTSNPLINLMENIGNLLTTEPAIKIEPLESTSLELPTELPTNQKDILQTTMENLGNLPTSEPAIKTKPLKTTSFMELPTELPTDYGKFIETTILIENIETLPTSEPAIITEPLESTSFVELTTALTTDHRELLEMTNFVELPTTQADMLETTMENLGNLVNLQTSEPAIKTEPLESTSFMELTTELPTDHGNFIETTILIENIETLPTSEPAIKTEPLKSTSFMEFTTELPTKQADMLETTTENIETLPTSDPIIKTEPLEVTSFIEITTELPTDNGELLKTTKTPINFEENIENLSSLKPVLKTEPLASTDFIELTTELPTDQAEILVTTTENIGNLSTSEPDIKTEPLEVTSFVELTTELPTDHGELLETTNTLINLKENIGNLPTTEPAMKTESLLSTTFMELPTDTPSLNVATGNSLNLSTEHFDDLANTKPELLSDQLESSALLELSQTNELPTSLAELTETTYNFIDQTTKLVNFTKENSVKLTTDVFTTNKELPSTPLINSDRTDATSGLSFKETLETTTESSINTIKYTTTDLSQAKSQDSKTTTEYYVKSKITDDSLAIETELLTEFSETTKNLEEFIKISTFSPTKLSTPSDVFQTIDAEMTATDLFLYASTTIDPRLPFRSPACQGDNNRRQFMATRCYQYYQCFAGWAFLLNCHDGWLFQTDIEACTQDVNNECKL